MRSLSKIITEKLKIDDVVLITKFPIDGSIPEIKEFLEKNGFEETTNLKSDKKIAGKALIRAKAKSYIIYNAKGVTTIFFADTSEGDLSKTNPMFGIQRDDVDLNDPTTYILYRGRYTILVQPSKEEFAAELKERFGWK